MDMPRLQDPRVFQITVLSLLLGYGVLVLDFGVRLQNAVAIMACAQAVQFLASRYAGIRFDPLSALITSLSLTLLLRTNLVSLAALAACIAIGSKFVVRVRGKHVFNPANVALVALMLLSDQAWISTGQWGNAALGAFAFVCLGFIVLTKARRAETTLSFLAAYGALVFGRALWLGDPLAIPLHQLQSGALLLFAFFMISDPMTTPDKPLGRIAYGILVAALAVVMQFIFYEPTGPILALVMTAPLVPLIDGRLGGQRYRWRGTPASPLRLSKGEI